MKTKKKRTWKFWTGRTLLVLLVLGGLWLTNLIWFKPFSINHFYEKSSVELVLNSPELSTQLGIPVIYDLYKDELDDISDAKNWKNLNKLKKDYETLMSYNYDNQSPENQLNTDILGYFLRTNFLENEPFFYHNYPVNQMEGIQSRLPSLMESSHKLRDKSDIEAYISRLSKFGIKFKQLMETLKIQESKNIIPPKFINKMVIDEMKGFVGESGNAATSNILYANFETKVDKLPAISKVDKVKYKKEVADEISKTVFPAYQNLITYFETLQKKATDDAGVWKLPNGDAYYRYLIKQHTTTDLSPEEIHNIGLAEVARIQKEMYAILEAEGYTAATKTIGQIIQQLYTEERFLYPNSDEGRKLILADYKRIIAEISEDMDKAFNIMPKAGIDVKRVPEFKEAGTAIAYYEPPALDGSKGGIFYTNLRNPRETVKFGMKTLAYHEGVPGHHFQYAIQNELKGLPTFRTVLPFNAYMEGWALYTEQLAYELGYYENDPFGNLGRLRGEIFRAVRLVVDTGIHHKRWTREQAIDYMLENTGMPVNEVTSEIERYVVLPGQACSYKIGMLKILELREKSKKELGSKFNLKDFHDVLLKNGSLPLDILEKVVNKYINTTLENENSSSKGG
jgi:uncharacterized protein (DUF885 family)